MNAKELHALAEQIVQNVDKREAYGSVTYGIVDKDKFSFGLKEPYELARHIIATVREDDD